MALIMNLTTILSSSSLASLEEFLVAFSAKPTSSGHRRSENIPSLAIIRSSKSFSLSLLQPC
jgi:hypothetical protein